MSNDDKVKSYIDLALKYWFTKWDSDFTVEDWVIMQYEWEHCSNMEHCIMKKQFITCIANAIWNRKPYGTSKWVRVKMVWDVGQLLYDNIDELINDITYEQAIAIRDNKIGGFIDRILYTK